MLATSADGTPIAFERLGEGVPPVVLVGGATAAGAGTAATRCRTRSSARWRTSPR